MSVVGFDSVVCAMMLIGWGWGMGLKDRRRKIWWIWLCCGGRLGCFACGLGCGGLGRGL